MEQTGATGRRFGIRRDVSLVHMHMIMMNCDRATQLNATVSRPLKGCTLLLRTWLGCSEMFPYACRLGTRFVIVTQDRYMISGHSIEGITWVVNSRSLMAAVSDVSVQTLAYSACAASSPSSLFGRHYTAICTHQPVTEQARCNTQGMACHRLHACIHRMPSQPCNPRHHSQRLLAPLVDVTSEIGI